MVISNNHHAFLTFVISKSYYLKLHYSFTIGDQIKTHLIDRRRNSAYLAKSIENG
jgi:hypothetical protein